MLFRTRIWGQVQFKEDLLKNTVKYVNNIKKNRADVDVICGYEAGFIGLVPGESSSGNTERMLGITKSGNRHLRRLAVEISNTYRRGAVGRKSAALKERQKDMPKDVVAYADKSVLKD